MSKLESSKKTNLKKDTVETRQRILNKGQSVIQRSLPALDKGRGLRKSMAQWHTIQTPYQESVKVCTF